MKTYRCFVAIELHDDVKDLLVQLQAALREWPGRVKWVEKNNFHLTLKFLGEISLAQVELAKDSLTKAAAGFKPFQLEIDALGAFPTLQYPKVIWAGINDRDGSLARLQAKVEEYTVYAGFPPDPKRFSPHLTLGRVKDAEPPSRLEDIVKKVAVPVTAIPVREVKLMRSQLLREGPIYSCLGSYIF